MVLRLSLFPSIDVTSVCTNSVNTSILSLALRISRAIFLHLKHGHTPLISASDSFKHFMWYQWAHTQQRTILSLFFTLHPSVQCFCLPSFFLPVLPNWPDEPSARALSLVSTSDCPTLVSSALCWTDICPTSMLRASLDSSWRETLDVWPSSPMVLAVVLEDSLLSLFILPVVFIELMSIHGQRLPVVLIQEASGASTPVARVLIQQCQQSEISNIDPYHKGMCDFEKFTHTVRVSMFSVNSPQKSIVVGTIIPVKIDKMCERSQKTCFKLAQMTCQVFACVKWIHCWSAGVFIFCKSLKIKLWSTNLEICGSVQTRELVPILSHTFLLNWTSSVLHYWITSP